MPLPTVTGRIDQTSGYVIPVNAGTWANLSSTTWSSWNNWVNQPADPLIWNTPVVDLGANIWFNITTATSVSGNIEYNVITSTTGNITGEETKTKITSADTGNLSAFYGRYVAISANVYNTGGSTVLYSMSFTTQNSSFTLTLNDIDSTQLTSNGSGVVLPISRTISAVQNIQVTPYIGSTTSTSTYVAADYITTGYFDDQSVSGAVFASIQSKNRLSPTVVFKDSAGSTASAVFDAMVTVLPEQARSGDNLVVK
jgi:hypothetical protein